MNIAGCAYGQPGSYYGKDHFGHAKKGREKRAVPGLEKYHGKDIYLTEALTLEMNEAISESVKANKPFFAYMSHYAVHAPFQADPRFIKNYTETKGNLAAFASMIEGMDKSLGDILNHLEKLNVAEDTIVFFLGDNGTDAPAGPTHQIACSAPLRGKKGTHYEGGMRVPFIAAWAKPNANNAFQKQTPIAQGTIVNNLGAVYDLYPTILALAGVKLPQKEIDGVNLQSILSGKLAPQERDFLMHFPHGHRSSYFTSYRKGDWKVIYHYQPGNKEKAVNYELFNLKTDRSESKNLADSNPAELKRMMTALSDQLVKAKAQYPVDKSGNELKPVIP